MNPSVIGLMFTGKIFMNLSFEGTEDSDWDLDIDLDHPNKLVDHF